MGVFTYREVQDVLFKEKRRHQDLLDSDSAQVNRDYSRYAIFVIGDLQKDFKRLFVGKYGKG